MYDEYGLIKQFFQHCLNNKYLRCLNSFIARTSMKNKKYNWGKYGFEFLSIFIAVLAAFALNNWNDNRNDNLAEEKILAEIANGLEKDIKDVIVNKKGHIHGIKACEYWRNVLTSGEVEKDSITQRYFDLTRDYVSIQNTSGYETLKSRGLELIDNDSLRLAIISLYEYDYNTLRKFEEAYEEMQFHKSYFDKINKVLAPKFKFPPSGLIAFNEYPVSLSEADTKILLSYFWKIQVNRQFILQFYTDIENKIETVLNQIETELN